MSKRAARTLSLAAAVLLTGCGVGEVYEDKDLSVLSDSEIETNVLGVYRDDISECQETIHNWLKEIGY